MEDNIPPKPDNSFRITLDLMRPANRLDAILLQAIKGQNENLTLREITRTGFKELFASGKIQIKGQNARPSSGLARGITYVDILGFKQK
ncbi:MAG: hypothetical protein V4654_13690 [Bdellovibrionota bacterium]